MLRVFARALLNIIATYCKPAQTNQAHLFFELQLLARLFDLVIGVLFHVCDVGVDMVQAHHDPIDELVMLHVLHGFLKMIQAQVRLGQDTIVPNVSGNLQVGAVTRNHG